MNDMRAVIVPKSDQMNADDLIGGPITITITEVVIKPGEQPVSIYFEGDNGKPYKCCKSMAKVMVSCWGPDANNYVGRSMTLYRDPKVKWGGMEVGGIRISHMSHLESAHTMALTETRGNKKPFTVKPLKVEKPKLEQPAEDPAVAYATKLTQRFAECPSIDVYNEITGNAVVAKNLAGLKAKRPDLWQQVEDARVDALDRISVAPPEPAHDADGVIQDPAQDGFGFGQEAAA